MTKQGEYEVHVHRNGQYWQARWTDQDGRRMCRGLGNRATVTQADAWAAALRLQDELRAEADQAERRRVPSLREAVDRWALENDDLAETSADLYHRTFRRLADIVGWDRMIDQVGGEDIDRFEASVKRLALITRRREMRHLGVLFRWAAERGWVSDLPTAGRKTAIPPVVRETVYVSLDDLERMLEAATDPHHRLLLAILRLAGLRLQEALHLEWRDVDWSKMTLTVRVRRGKRTTKERQRTLPIEPWLAEILREHAGVPMAKVCGGMTKHRASALTADVMDACGLTYPDRHHALRRSLETDWLDRGLNPMSVCTWLGHHPTVAMKHYNDDRLAMSVVSGHDARPAVTGPLRPARHNHRHNLGG